MINIVETRNNEATQPGLWFIGSQLERANFTEYLLPIALGAAAAGRIPIQDVDSLTYTICRGSALYSVPGTLKVPLIRMLDADLLPSILSARRRGVLKQGVANKVMSAQVREEVTLLNRAEHLAGGLFWLNSDGFVARPKDDTLTVATFERGTGPWKDFDEQDLALADSAGATHIAERRSLVFSKNPSLPPQLDDSVWAVGVGEGNSFRQLAEKS